jgi:hypothetical protein
MFHSLESEHCVTAIFFLQQYLKRENVEKQVINANTLFHTHEYDSDTQLPYFFPFSHGQVKHP